MAAAVQWCGRLTRGALSQVQGGFRRNSAHVGRIVSDASPDISHRGGAATKGNEMGAEGA